MIYNLEGREYRLNGGYIKTSLFTSNFSGGYAEMAVHANRTGRRSFALTQQTVWIELFLLLRPSV